MLFLGPEANNAEAYGQLLTQITSQSGPEVANAYRGDKLITPDGLELSLLWPTPEFVSRNTVSSDLSASRNFTDKGVFLGAKTSKELNEYGLVLRLNYGHYVALFMGDAESVA